MAALAVAEVLAFPKLQRARGEGRVMASVRNGQTEIATLYQEGCAKIRLPHTHSDALQAVLMNTAGGLTGGDHVRWSATAAAGAKLVLTTPACERVYRSLGSDAVVTPAGDGAAFIDGVDAVAIGDAALRAGVAIHQLITQLPDLEAAFLELTAGKAAIR